MIHSQFLCCNRYILPNVLIPLVVNATLPYMCNDYFKV